MAIQPIRDRVLLLLDPIPEHRSGILLPDLDTIKLCRRCDMRREKLATTPCVPQEEYRTDLRTDRVHYVRTHQEHQIYTIQAPISPERTRRGLVVALGPRARQDLAGLRVLVDFMAGGGDEDYRIVRDSEILARLEDEAA